MGSILIGGTRLQRVRDLGGAVRALTSSIIWIAVALVVAGCASNAPKERAYKTVAYVLSINEAKQIVSKVLLTEGYQGVFYLDPPDARGTTLVCAEGELRAIRIVPVAGLVDGEVTQAFEFAGDFTSLLYQELATTGRRVVLTSARPKMLFWEVEAIEIRLNAAPNALSGISAVSVLGEVKMSPERLASTIRTAIEPVPQSNLVMSLGASSPAGATSRWEVSQSYEGVIVTDWKRVPGKKAGLLWWEKEYECEARHTITIRRNLSRPELSSFAILTETRERPNPNYEWAEADPEYGRSSFEDIKRVIVSATRHATVGRTSGK